MKILIKMLIVLATGAGLMWSLAWAGEEAGEGLDLKNYREPMENIITGGQPSEADLKALAERGVTLIINFRAPGEFDEFDEGKVVESLGMRYLNIPIPKMKDDMTPENAELLHDALHSSGGPVVLHCRSGMRAGGMLALDQYYFHGLSEEAAVALGTKAHTDQVAGAIKDSIEKNPKE